MTEHTESIPIREALARYLYPDDLGKGYALIDEDTGRLVRRIRIVQWTMRLLFAAGLAALLIGAQPGWLRVLEGFCLLAAFVAFELYGLAALNTPVFGFLWPTPDPRIKAFMDMLASGELQAFTEDSVPARASATFADPQSTKR